MKKQISKTFLIPVHKGVWGHVDKDGWTTAHMAAKYAEIHALNFLNCLNPKLISQPNKYGVRPIHIAAANDHVEIIEFLIKVDHDNLHAVTNNGWNVVHFAASNGNGNSIEFLKQTSVDLDKKDILGNVPMMLAHQNKHFSCVRKLVYTPKFTTCTIL